MLVLDVFSNKLFLIFFISPDSDHSVILKEVNVPLWRNDDCERSLRFHFGPNYKLPATTLCAGAEGRDACDVSIS